MNHFFPNQTSTRTMHFYFYPILPLLLFCITRAKTSENKLLLISLDGFSYDYLNKYKAPNLNQLAAGGVSTPDGMIPVFPSFTAPNHQTLVTGLFPESHGIINNQMYDPELHEIFNYAHGPSEWWSAAEPIWITARHSGLKTGVSFWPGSHVRYNGVMANFYEEYEDNQNFSKRVTTVTEWLVDRNVSFVALYFEEPDEKGHSFGPESEPVANIVEYVDGVVGDLLARLKEANVLDRLNIIVTTDHGMSPVVQSKPNALVLKEHLNPDDYDLILQTGPMGTVLPKAGKEDKVFDALNNKHAHVKIYYKEDIPERWHYRRNRLVLPIVAVAEEGYFVSRDDSYFRNTTSGMHGYDNQVVNMRGLFVASGPAFKRNVQLPAFDNVDVYSLMCHLLEITPKPSNGSLSTFLPVLVNDVNEATKTNVIKQASFVVPITVSLIWWKT